MRRSGCVLKSRAHARGRTGTLLCSVLSFCAVSAEQVAESEAVDTVSGTAGSSADAASRLHLLRAGTEVRLRLLEAVGSHTHKRGDRFNLEVAQIITAEGEIIVPAGSAAIGEVVHAAKPGMSGKPGELILVARFLRAGDREVRLRSFVAANGEDRYGLATGLGVTVGIPALFVVGKNLVLPPGTDVYAKVTMDTSLPSIAGTEAAALPQPSVEEASMEINENEPHQE